jgi:hypothetical protein
MSQDENAPPLTIGRRQREDALQLGPRKKGFVAIHAF